MFQCNSEIISTIGNLENLLAAGAYPFRVFSIKLREEFNSKNLMQTKRYLLTSIFIIDPYY